jgi:hypothetical protein
VPRYPGWTEANVNLLQPPALALFALVLDSCGAKLGQHYGDLTSTETSNILKNLFAGNLLFDLSVSFSKISAMAFYGRVFSVRSNINKAWRWSFYVILGFTIIWPLAIIPFDIFQCKPVHRFWNPEVPGSCIRQFDTFVSSAAEKVIIDLMVLILPLPPIFQLKMGLGKKLLIVAAFIVGYR